jgi:hypothetical protein
MIEDGRAFGATLVLKHVLGLLEGKGLVTQRELTETLDAALEELRVIGNQPNVIAPSAAAEAGRAIGLLYVR